MEKPHHIQLTRPDSMSYQACLYIHHLANTTLDELTTHLHPKEKHRVNTIKHSGRKMTYAAGRCCAKKAISALTDAPLPGEILIDQGVFHYPIVHSPAIQNIQVSICHCDAYAAAVAFPEQHPLGIDIEQINSKRAQTAATQHTEDEREYSQSIPWPHDTRILGLWTAKEALSKVLRVGLTTPFQILETTKATLLNPTQLECHFKNFSQYKAITTIHHNTLFTLALPKNTEIDEAVLRAPLF